MKKILSISILLFLFACEDSELAATLDGTYKLSEAYMDCDGDTDIVYTTIDGLTVTRWDYYGDVCDDGDDCYYTEAFPATKDGDALKVDLGNNEGTVVITRNGTNGLKTIWSHPDETDDYSQIWDYESSEIKTFSPVNILSNNTLYSSPMSIVLFISNVKSE